MDDAAHTPPLPAAGLLSTGGSVAFNPCSIFLESVAGFTETSTQPPIAPLVISKPNSLPSQQVIALLAK